MRAAIHNPYWDTLGGGERYSLAFAEYLVKAGYEVFIEWPERNILDQLKIRFGRSIEGINVVDDIKKGDGYDVCFWVSDGSIPLLKSRKNILHFQIPFRNVSGKSLLNRMKLVRINKVVCNSYFTKTIIDREYGVSSIVVFPPVDTKVFTVRRKENIILSVARFSQLTQSKKQEILIEVFKKLYDEGAKKWRLIMAGGSEIGGKEYLRYLKNKVSGYPIEFVENPDFKKLLHLYSKSKIFWTASGYGVDEIKHPKKVEHFGITLIEAMASGNVPLAFNAGGHKEIILDYETGFLWNTKEKLFSTTLSLIKNKAMLGKMSLNCQKEVKKYDYEKFNSEAENILK